MILNTLTKGSQPFPTFQNIIFCFLILTDTCISQWWISLHAFYRLPIYREANLFKSVLVILKVRLSGILWWGWFGWTTISYYFSTDCFKVVFYLYTMRNNKILELESENLEIAVTINEIILVKYLWKCDVLFFDWKPTLCLALL